LSGIFFVGQGVVILLGFGGVALVYDITLLGFYCSVDGSEYFEETKQGEGWIVQRQLVLDNVKHLIFNSAFFGW
jgi:hypothetical protein